MNLGRVDLCPKEEDLYQDELECEDSFSNKDDSFSQKKSGEVYEEEEVLIEEEEEVEKSELKGKRKVKLEREK